ncbi:MAG: glucosylglycerol hydrolase, partial [Candidatus Competibacteraceae bacterium]|nr:glucosylglycerol hydrolase [Candidatus Competibacteraceae bacterium]
LRTARPDEYVDFVATLHNFPTGPIRYILDVVFGHNDNQAVPLLNRHFFAGANMYGQNNNFRHPVVRAILLEMQRRKVDLSGADGVRVDGAQDFKWWDAKAEVLRHDNEYLLSMSDIVQEVAGTRYRPWFIYEDGRPWPQEDWELSSTYRAVIDFHPDKDVFQWGPLTFAHNTPFLYTFWVQKWWRIREILYQGSNWISGCANHDTLRRGTQVDPEQRINTRLGDTLLEIIDKAYDNPATSLVTYGMFPGVPMEFLNALMRASWGFIRNTDDKYGIKVVSEEGISLHWQVDYEHWMRPGNFRRLKAMGFEDLEGLKRFMKMLNTAVIVTDYDLDAIVALMRAVDPPLDGPELSVKVLKHIARAWMEDMHDYCNVSYYKEDLNPDQVGFNRKLREFRQARPWLRDNLTEGDTFNYRHPTQGTVLFYGHRTGPDGEQVLFAANMEGAPVEIVPVELPIEGLDKEGWQPALTAPGLEMGLANEPVTLHDGQGFLLIKQ